MCLLANLNESIYFVCCLMGYGLYGIVRSNSNRGQIVSPTLTAWDVATATQEQDTYISVHAAKNMSM